MEELDWRLEQKVDAVPEPSPGPVELRAWAVVILWGDSQNEEPRMIDSESNGQKIERPAEHYRTPNDISNDATLSREEKRKALDTWEQDAHQLLTASGEGMPGSKEGLRPTDHHRLGEVVRAKEQSGLKPTHKAAQ
jgi:hypothetical protein